MFPSLALYIEVIVSPLSFFAFSYPDLPILLFGHHFVLNRAIKWSAASKQEVSVDRQLSWKPLNEKPLRTRLGFPQTGRHIVLNRAITWSAECQKFHQAGCYLEDHWPRNHWGPGWDYHKPAAIQETLGVVSRLAAILEKQWPKNIRWKKIKMCA